MDISVTKVNPDTTVMPIAEDIKAFSSQVVKFASAAFRATQQTLQICAYLTAVSDKFDKEGLVQNDGALSMEEKELLQATHEILNESLSYTIKLQERISKQIQTLNNMKANS